MDMYHGTRLYAVYGRDIGTFGGRAKRPSLKIYDGSDCATPRTTISASLRLAQARDDLEALKGDRDQIDAYLRRYLPSTDPYRLSPSGHDQ